MTIENKLKNLIIDKYGSMLEFSKATGISNSTIASIMSRGVNKASVSNIIKICKELDISADELANNRIVPVSPRTDFTVTELRDILSFFRINMTEYENYTLDGIPITEKNAEMFLYSLELALDFIKKGRELEG